MATSCVPVYTDDGAVSTGNDSDTTGETSSTGVNTVSTDADPEYSSTGCPEAVPTCTDNEPCHEEWSAGLDANLKLCDLAPEQGASSCDHMKCRAHAHVTYAFGVFGCDQINWPCVTADYNCAGGCWASFETCLGECEPVDLSAMTECRAWLDLCLATCV